jgi:hypothetical protein
MSVAAVGQPTRSIIKNKTRSVIVFLLIVRSVCTGTIQAPSTGHRFPATARHAGPRSVRSDQAAYPDRRFPQVTGDKELGGNRDRRGYRAGGLSQDCGDGAGDRHKAAPTDPARYPLEVSPYLTCKYHLGEATRAPLNGCCRGVRASRGDVLVASPAPGQTEGRSSPHPRCERAEQP